nr:pentapeptide repeat-containing protein [Desulfobacterales bacterium]
NTKLIAEQQIEAAHIRAQRVELSANSRSRADRDVAKLIQIKDIFEKITAQEEGEDLSTLKLLISSLEIYGDLALDFLVNIRDIYKDENPVLTKCADDAIFSILQASQAEFTGYKFDGGSDVLNLRTRQFNGYNFSGSTFRNVNLFKAGFRSSTLKDVKFENADLVGADFRNANLSGAVFDGNTDGETDLRNTDFSHAYLKEVNFNESENLRYAKFSILALLNADEDPFKAIKKEIYLELLIHNITDEKDIDKIEKAYEKDEGKLRALLAKVEMEYDQLIKYLQENHDQRMASAQNDDSHADTDA